MSDVEKNKMFRIIVRQNLLWHTCNIFSKKVFTFTKPYSKPGTELAGEAAAALAASSLVFSMADMKGYAQLCLKHAMELFNFANKHRGFYHDAIPQDMGIFITKK